jgi:hypothetical protein
MPDGMDIMVEVLQPIFSSSDFPHILQAVASTTLWAGFCAYLVNINDGHPDSFSLMIIMLGWISLSTKEERGSRPRFSSNIAIVEGRRLKPIVTFLSGLLILQPPRLVE